VFDRRDILSSSFSEFLVVELIVAVLSESDCCKLVCECNATADFFLLSLISVWEDECEIRSKKGRSFGFGVDMMLIVSSNSGQLSLVLKSSSSSYKKSRLT